MESPSIAHLTATEVAQLDPYAFLAMGEKPTTAPPRAVAQADEVAEGIAPERMS